MVKNIVSGIIGAIVGGVVLYFLIGIPGEVQQIDRRVSKLEGQFDIFMALRADVKDLKSKVSSVEEQILTMKGRSGRWGSGWMEFDEKLDLYKGDALLIKVGGTAQKVLVRLLPHGKSSDFPIGILPDRFEVPPGREILVELREDYKGISQISVHGGPEPWGKYSLGKIMVQLP